jgi:hypothetical protein
MEAEQQSRAATSRLYAYYRYDCNGAVRDEYWKKQDDEWYPKPKPVEAAPPAATLQVEDQPTAEAQREAEHLTATPAVEDVAPATPEEAPEGNLDVAPSSPSVNQDAPDEAD